MGSGFMGKDIFITKYHVNSIHYPVTRIWGSSYIKIQEEIDEAREDNILTAVKNISILHLIIETLVTPFAFHYTYMITSSSSVVIG